MADWSKEKERQILLKYRFTLTLKIIRVLLAILFLFWIYMMVVNYCQYALNLDKKHAYNIKLVMDWTMPNLQENFGEINNSEINPFLTQEISFPVSKVVGKEEKVVGEMEITKALINPFSHKSVRYFQANQTNNYRFFLPEHPKTGEKLTAEDDAKVWEQLDKIHEGTVAELSFSTSEFMSADNLIALLEPYDLDILWAPLVTGEFTEFEPAGYGGAEGTLSIDYLFGLTGGREISDDFRSEAKFNQLKADVLEQSEAMMLTSMETLLKEESTSYIEDFLGFYSLEERYRYLKKNGFKVYGAVVTGPVKELLRLKDVNEIRGAQLGELDYWNWETE